MEQIFTIITNRQTKEENNSLLIWLSLYFILKSWQEKPSPVLPTQLNRLNPGNKTLYYLGKSGFLIKKQRKLRIYDEYMSAFVSIRIIGESQSSSVFNDKSLVDFDELHSLLCSFYASRFTTSVTGSTG